MIRRIAFLSLAVLMLASVAVPVLAADAVATIRGGGAFGDRGGVHENHQPYFDHVSVNATLNDDGSAEGTMIWTSEWNAFFDPHSDLYAKQWKIRVEGWYPAGDGTVALFGTIVHSTLKSDEGLGATIPFFDGGNGNPDSIFGIEIGGNVVIKSP